MIVSAEFAEGNNFGSAWRPVMLPVFKTGGRRLIPSSVGSTPTRFRHSSSAYSFGKKQFAERRLARAVRGDLQRATTVTGLFIQPRRPVHY